jgi:hypothetical protein
MNYYLKDPDSRVDYGIDWIAYLGDQTLAASQWSVTPSEAGGVALETASFDLRRTAARIFGGLPGHVYNVSNRVMLSDGSSDERSICLRVEQR